ncbi:SusC/RagA family TonB-linked outer membrane protein [Sphingobacterium deserti]|uniref:TonB-dependent receptor plug n=1 Tax=Sphingobacterium deserti TaxID=1229276 RepID=A0A0B8SZP0_9SPHI|nr:SusC/RagA family TonB-linked outer membrane protein [Sphingobacterium deserti]KGE13071.1 TonB-dependent receptor plug [Sphingobacterium deserti]
MTLSLASWAFAQETGQVVVIVQDAESKSLPNATITLSNSKLDNFKRIGLSDEQGKAVFASLVADSNYCIQVTFTGLQPQQECQYIVSEGKRSSVVIQLRDPILNDMDEVVVVGYGTQKKVNLSGAVDYISGEVLESRPISNIAQGLQGIAPNLNVQFNSGAPGATPNINIRGITSINGGDPLILVDNVPVTTAELIRIAPQDIESFSIIKDASAAAIYGARASFGVIIITTKVGKGDAKVSYSNNFTWNTPTVMPDKITDPYVFSRLLQTSTDNTPWNNVNYSDQHYQYAKERSDDPSIPGVRINPSDSKSWEYMGDRDWTRYFLSDWNSAQTHDLSISGAGEKVQYYLSGSYNRQNSPVILTDDYFDRYNLRAKVNYKLADFISFGNNTVIGSTRRLSPSRMDLAAIYNVFPTSYDKNPDGTWANTSVGRLAAEMVDGGKADIKRMDVQSTFNTELRFFKNMFKINADYTFQRNSMNRNEYRTQYNIGFGPDDVRKEGTSEAFREAGFSYYNVYNIFGTYAQTFNKHAIAAVLGFNQESFRYELLDMRRQGLISETYPTIEFATGTTNVGEGIDTYALRGAFYRLNYTYDDKYIVEFNGRYDGSSRFPKDKRFGFFPSGSVAWRLDRENFLRDVSAINLLKLRASYGALGNQSVSNYGYLASMAKQNSEYLIGGAQAIYIDVPPLVSPNYTWEEVNTINVGLDMAILKNKLSASFDYYTRETLGMLTMGRELPNVLGALEPNENAADLRTNGWELTLSYQDRFELAGSPLGFNAKVLLSDSYSEITRFDNPNNSITNYYKGMRMGEIWGLESDGFFTNTAEIAALDQSSIIPWGALSIVPGWPKYVDQDGNGVIEKGYTVGDTKDLKSIGNSTPRYQFGIDLSADWKGFDLRTFFQGIAKRDYYPIDYLYWGVYQQPYGNFYGHLLDFYRATSDTDAERARHSQSYLNLGLADQNLDATYPVLQSWLADRNLGTRIDQAQGLAIPQTNYLLNAAYLRLKNLTVGYTLPKAWTSRAKISHVRLYLSGENLIEWSAVKRYFDPETLNENTYTDPQVSPERVGNGLTYPFQRSFSGGIQVTF